MTEFFCPVCGQALLPLDSAFEAVRRDEETPLCDFCFDRYVLLEDFGPDLDMEELE